jgi:hypothetical protein
MLKFSRTILRPPTQAEIQMFAFKWLDDYLDLKEVSAYTVSFLLRFTCLVGKNAF